MTTETPDPSPTEGVEGAKIPKASTHSEQSKPKKIIVIVALSTFIYVGVILLVLIIGVGLGAWWINNKIVLENARDAIIQKIREKPLTARKEEVEQMSKYVLDYDLASDPARRAKVDEEWNLHLDEIRDIVLNDIASLPQTANLDESSRIYDEVTEYNSRADPTRAALFDSAFSRKMGTILDTERDAMLSRIAALPDLADAPTETSFDQVVKDYCIDTLDDARKTSVKSAWSAKQSAIRMAWEAESKKDPSKPVWAIANGKDGYGSWADVVIGGELQRLRWCSPGTFLMGWSEEESQSAFRRDQESNSAPDHSFYVASQHLVTLTHGYWMADSPCTQALWMAVMGTNPSKFRDDSQCPVEMVSWEESQSFVAKISNMISGLQARLPNEAEWEYASRARTSDPYQDGTLYAASWLMDNASGTTHPVKLKSPNAWGLYDMLGNVGQWCNDWHDEYPSTSVVDPHGPDASPFQKDRIYRGGGWICSVGLCRSACRSWTTPSNHCDFLGFRFVVPAH